MKSVFKDWLRLILASLFFFSGLAWVRAKLIQRRHPLIRVLLTHHIRRPAAFENMARHLASHYRTISYKDLREGRFSQDKVNILLTLDDGYSSWHQEGLPVLERYNLPAVFFVASGFVIAAHQPEALETYTKDNLKLKGKAEPLSPEALRDCAKHPFITIGGHSVTHPFMDQISPDRAKEEISEDKRYLENITEHSCDIFAFPFGRGCYSDELSKILKESGYSHAVTTHSDFYRPGSDPYRIPRSNHGTVSPLILRMWVWGAFDLVEKVENATRRAFVKLK